MMPMLRTRTLEQLAKFNHSVNTSLYECQKYIPLVKKPMHRKQLMEFQVFLEMTGAKLDELQFGLSIRSDIIELDKKLTEEVFSLILSIVNETTKMALVNESYNSDYGGVAQF